MVRIGVIADSHVGEYLSELPAEVDELLAGCDRIIHAGDVSRGWVLDQLAAIAPVTAVQGDHDTFGDIDLPRVRVIEVEGARIGVVHGRRIYGLEVLVTLVTVLSGGRVRWDGGLARHLLRQTGPVDLMIHGHWHIPVDRTVNGTRIFCPGALCPLGSLAGGRSARPGVGGVVDRTVARFRRLHGPEAQVPAIGIVEVRDGEITARRLTIGDGLKR